MTAVQDQTRQRLLEAAGEEFAAHGFEAARVRSICGRAGANLAAVNYHFGDKERLYVAAVIEAHQFGPEPAPHPAGAVGSPAERLRCYVRHFLESVLAVNRQDRWHHRLMLRELVRPTSACEAVVRRAIRPRFEELRAILTDACPATDGRRLDALTFSVVGQCLHYKLTAHVSESLIGPEAFAALDLGYLTDHITGMTLAALGLGPPVVAG